MDQSSTRRPAHEDLQYIRRTLDAAGRFSSVSGRGFVLIGLLALSAVAINRRVTGAPWDQHARPEWTLGVWALLLAVSLLTGIWCTALKARRTGQVFWSPVLRKALWGYGAAMLLGGILTAGVIRVGHPGLLPQVWLGSYGAALVSAGVMSVSPVRWMGIAFLALAGLAAMTPPEAGLALLGLGFGFLHVGFGAFIAWRHDG